MAMGDKLNDRFTLLLRHIAPDLPGCGDPIITQELHKAAAEFMRIAKAWRETLTLGDIEDDTSFKVAQSDGYRARAETMWVKIDGVEIPRQFYRLDFPSSAGEAQTLTILDPYDAVESGEVTAKVLWIPTFDAGDMPEWAIDSFSGGFINITRGRAMMMPKKPWSDFPAGKEYLRLGQAEAMRARSEADRNDPTEFET